MACTSITLPTTLPTNLSGISPLPPEVASEAARTGHVLVDGFQHRYYRVAPPEAQYPSLLALHGFGTTGERTFRHIAPPLLREGMPLVAPDLLGFGDSDKPRSGYSLDQYASLVAGIAEATDLERPILLGHSMGGKVAAATAALYPDRFRALILVNSGGFAALDPWLARLGDAGIMAALFRQDWFFYRLLPRTPLGPVFSSEESRKQVLRFRRSNRALDLHLTGLDRRLARLQIPVLVLWGKNDRLLPRHAPHRTRRSFPNARLEMLDHAGHAPMKDQPELLAASIVQFARSLTP